MNYGPNLKSGDTLVYPSGEEGLYFATAAETLAFVEENVPDGIWKSDHLPILQAEAYAERVGFPLDIRTMSVRSIYAELEVNKLLEMPDNSTLTTESGRLYERSGRDIYYNSNPKDNNLWGSLSGGAEYYVKHKDEFVHVKQETNMYDSDAGENKTIYVSVADGPRVAFDEKGNFDTKWTSQMNR